MGIGINEKESGPGGRAPWLTIERRATVHVPLAHQRRCSMRALVLEGGGAKGAYHIGAWGALRERGETFDIVTGTSVGALNGALIALDDYDVAYQLWSQITIEQVIKGDPELLEKLVNMQVNANDYQKLLAYFKEVVGQKGLDITPLEGLLKKYVCESRLRQSPVRFGMVTVSLSEAKPLELAIDEIPEGLLHRYLLASSNLPVFQMKRLKGQIYIDGGFYDNLPVALAKRMGATDFTTIELGAIGVKRIPKNFERRTIAPKVDLGPILGLTPAMVQRNLKLGYFDGLKMLDQLKGTHYYIVDDVASDRLMQALVSLDEAAIKSLAAILGIDGMDPKRFTFQVLLPKLGELLGVDSKAPYGDILIALLEAIGDDANIDRFSVRPLTGFLSEVRSAYIPGTVYQEQINLIDKLFLKTHLIGQGHNFGQTQRMALFKTVYEKLLLNQLTSGGS